MKNVCASGQTVAGYDVSHYQPNLNVHAHMAQAGKKFCIIKATEGANIVDHLFSAHWKAAKAAGMIVGAYNFFHPSVDTTAQAKRFESVIGKLGAGDLAPVLDWEKTDGISAVRDRSAAQSFIQDVAQVTGKNPIIYGAPYFLQALGLGADFIQHPLWIAHYGAKCPLIPFPWTAWTMWQYTSGGGLDLNLYNGSLDQLKGLTA